MRRLDWFKMKYYDRYIGELGDYKLIRIDDQKNVVKIINKLCRHFKLPKLKTVFRKHTPDGGTCFTRTGIVSFHPRHINIRVVCHEVSHWMDHVKNHPKKWHTKRQIAYQKRLLRYCEKMNYWGWATKVESISNL